MIVSPKGLNQNVEVYYWLGKFDKLGCRFVPDDEEPMYWDYGENTYIGPSGMIDPRTGRALIFTIAAGGRGPGWAAGCVSLPQHIFLNEDGSLGVKPIEELQSLRNEELLSVTDATVIDVNQKLKQIQGEMLEILIEFKSKATNKYGIKVLKSPDGKEESLIYYDPHNKKLGLETSKSSLRRRSFNRRASTDTRAALKGHFDIGDENLKLHIFIDHALVEVFANDKNTITKWIYPSLSESNGIQIDAPENAIVKSIKIWNLQSIYYKD
jgi:sucrose-6-phosphate hydrolase SacC (GH32 family)